MSAKNSELSLESIVSTAITIPGVKVDRRVFLSDTFKNDHVNTDDVIRDGPVHAGCSRDLLQKKANDLIFKRTSESSIASFIAGIPGGFGAGIAIPTDILQFFGIALRLAQELAYLYGCEDLWNDGKLDETRVKGTLILYCGVMFGVSGAANCVRLLSSQLAKTIAEKLPQKALTKTIMYPIVRQIAKRIGVNMTKTSFAKGISKVIPIIGGVISGGLTFASMMPMAKRLATTLDDACFDYSEEEINEDINIIKSMMEQDVVDAEYINESTGNKPTMDAVDDDVFVKIEKLARLREFGILTQEEFDTKKSDLLNRI